MGMTRRDFELLADTFREQIDSRREKSAAQGYSALCLTVWELADNLAEYNPRFDKVRFIESCGLATK